MHSATVEILKAMLEAGLAKIKAMEGDEQIPTTETETKPTKKATASKTKKKAAEEATPEPAPTPDTASEETAKVKEVTLKQIRAVLQEKRAEGKKDKFAALFESFGVQRLPDVSPDQYAALLAAAEAL